MSYSLKQLKLETAFAQIQKGNYQAAFPTIRQFAENGDVDCQYQLGFMYQTGAGLKQDNDLAAKWYTKAAEQGDVDCQVILAEWYDDNEQYTK